MKKITIVDYGTGNILSVKRALEHCGADVMVSSNYNEIANAERIIVPGVGAFLNCMQALENKSLRESVVNFAASGRPYLGICVGMQMMLELSEEFGEHKGLGYIKGHVKKIIAMKEQGNKVPFIGWKPLQITNDSPLLKGIAANDRFYFVHSYQASPENNNNLLATYEFNDMPVAAVIGKDNIFGTQFHPEKSGDCGLKVVKNFLSV